MKKFLSILVALMFVFSSLVYAEDLEENTQTEEIKTEDVIEEAVETEVVSKEPKMVKGLTVNYYKEDLSGEYILEETLIIPGKTGDTIIVPKREYENYEVKNFKDTFILSDNYESTLNIYYKLKSYNVIYEDGLDGTVFQKKKYTVKYGENTPEFIGYVNRPDYSFVGFTPNISETVSEDVIYTAVYTKKEEPKETYYTLTFETYGGDEIYPEKHRENAIVLLTYYPKKDDYVFVGWFKDKNFTEEVTSIQLTQDLTVYAKYIPFEELNTPIYGPSNKRTNKKPKYIEGYKDGTFKPNNYMTRAEAFTTIYRILPEDLIENAKNILNFEEIDITNWYDESVAILKELNIISGDENGEINPNGYITRAEFVTLCNKLIGTETEETDIKNSFVDIEDHWAKEEIEKAVAFDFVKGYEDDTFKPDSHITRAETVCILNKILNKTKNDISETATEEFEDVYPNDWYYNEIVIATNEENIVVSEDEKQKLDELKEETTVEINNENH